MESIPQETPSLETYGSVYKEWREWFSERKKTAERLARIGMVALLLSPSGKALAEEYSADKQDVPVLSGETEKKAELADGQAIELPQYPGMRLKVFGEAKPDKLILYFPQEHSLPAEELAGLSPDEKAESLRAAVESQKKLYAVMKDLASREILTNVCVEGEHDDAAIRDDVRFAKRTMPITVAAVVGPYMTDGKIFQAIDTIGNVFRDRHMDDAERAGAKEAMTVLAGYVPEYKYLIGGAQLLAIEDALQVSAAENKDALMGAFAPEILALEREKPMAEWTPEERSLWQTKVFENREDAALRILSGQQENVVGLTFGEQHRFEDALDRYHQQSPEVTFAFAEYRYEPEIVVASADTLPMTP